VKYSDNNIIGVGRWVEGTNGRLYRIDPRDPWSWFLFPWITLKDWLS